MLTLQETIDLVETLNEEAHQQSWDTWTEADALMDSDEEDDWEAAEELREDASAEQASYFRDEYYSLSEEQKKSISHWITEDEDFREQFMTYFGENEFFEEFVEEE